MDRVEARLLLQVGLEKGGELGKGWMIKSLVYRGGVIENPLSAGKNSA